MCNPQCFEEWHELSLQKQWELYQQLARTVGTCSRYFEHCQRVSISARHAGCDSAEMDVRQALKGEAVAAIEAAEATGEE